MDEQPDDWMDDDEPTEGYGAFPGGDPRFFDPDPECSTEAERAAHAVACREADAMEARGEAPDWPSAHCMMTAHECAAHVAMTEFGLGTYRRGAL